MLINRNNKACFSVFALFLSIVFSTQLTFARDLHEEIGGISWTGGVIDDGILSSGSAAWIDIPTTVTGDVTIPSTLEGYPVILVTSTFILTHGQSLLKSITIPATVKEIDEFAFCRCNALTSIEIPARVEKIGYGAFQDCSSITNVTIPPSVREIGDYVFSGCESLVSVTLSDGVPYIGGDMFGACSSLKSVSIPSSVVNIKFGAFKYCESLMSLVIPSSVTNMESHVFYEAPTFVLFEGPPPSGSSFVGNNIGFYLPEYAKEWEQVIDQNGKWRSMLMLELSEDDDELGYFDKTDVESGVWMQNQDYYDYTGFDVTMGSRAMPQTLFTQGKDVAYGYGLFEFNARVHGSVTLRCEIDTGLTGVYWLEATSAQPDWQQMILRCPCSVVEGFPTMGGLGSYTFKATVSCDGYRLLRRRLIFRYRVWAFRCLKRWVRIRKTGKQWQTSIFPRRGSMERAGTNGLRRRWI